MNQKSRKQDRKLSYKCFRNGCNQCKGRNCECSCHGREMSVDVIITENFSTVEKCRWLFGRD